MKFTTIFLISAVTYVIGSLFLEFRGLQSITFLFPWPLSQWHSTVLAKTFGIGKEFFSAGIPGSPQCWLEYPS